MKRTIALLIVLLMMFSVNVNADTAQTEKINDVLLSVKERIGSTDKYTDFNSGVSEYGNKTVYRFEWSNNNDNGDYAYMNTAVDQSGVIIEYNVYSSGDNLERKPSIKGPSVDEAMKNAKILADKLNPSLSGELKIESNRNHESLYTSEHSFRVQRYVNGIPVMGDNGNITISADMKTITYFSLNYTHSLNFENEKPVLSREDAVKAFGEKIGLKLCYVNTYTDNKNTISLRYVPQKSYNVYIDAVTGEAVEPKQTDEYGNYKMTANDAAMESAGGGGSALTRAEITELEKVEGLLGIDEAKDLIKSIKILDIDNNFNAENISLNRHWNDKEKYIYNFGFTNQKDDKRIWKDVSLDARTGEILSFYGYRDYSNKDNAFKGENAFKKAEEAVKILAPKHFSNENNEFRLNEYNDDATSFTYTRYPNDTEFAENYVNIGINPADGSLVSYAIQYDDFDFPPVDTVLDKTVANEKMFEQIPYNVWYVKNGKDAIKVYSYENSYPQIDANTGKLINASYEVQKLKYNDIETHYAKEQIETLARYGIGFDGDSFMPDEFITQKDFVGLINAVFYDRGPIVIAKDYDYTSAYRYINNRGVLKAEEYNPDGKVTRQMASVMLVRGMGLEEAAQLDGIFVPLWSDVTENIGYTSILGAMGVIKGDENNKFNPTVTLTRADAVIMLYNYLTK